MEIHCVACKDKPRYYFLVESWRDVLRAIVIMRKHGEELFTVFHVNTKQPIGSGIVENVKSLKEILSFDRNDDPIAIRPSDHIK